jgi:hypothetical protein
MLQRKTRRLERQKNKAHFTKINFELKQVQKEAVWDGVIQADSRWCFVSDASVRTAMREMRKNHVACVSVAKKLSGHILEEFAEEKQKQTFSNLVEQKDYGLQDFLKEYNIDVATAQ